MEKKQRKMLAFFASRSMAAIAFALALALVVMPARDAAVPTALQTELSLPAGAVETRELPEIGDKLIPLGRTTGIKLYSPGTVVVGFSQLECSGTCPARECGLQIGDVLLQLNGQKISGNESLTALLGDLTGEQAVFTVSRDGAEQLITVSTVWDESLQRWRIGAWIRDSVAGIGTITFVDPQTGVFGALGHGICDADTGELVAFGSGAVMHSSVTGVQKSKSGTPGQLQGQFDLVNDQGWLASNCHTGIYGKLTGDELYAGQTALEVAGKKEIHPGSATIISNVSGTEAKEYDVKIIKVYDGNDGRDLLLEVIDTDLISLTGGIVQGMSGSPIIQDGKLVGAVTHVLVNDPTRGYGIFIENMLDEAG